MPYQLGYVAWNTKADTGGRSGLRISAYRAFSERAKRLELSTFSLARRRSTIELHPHLTPRCGGLMSLNPYQWWYFTSFFSLISFSEIVVECTHLRQEIVLTPNEEDCTLYRAPCQPKNPAFAGLFGIYSLTAFRRLFGLITRRGFARKQDGSFLKSLVVCCKIISTF